MIGFELVLPRLSVNSIVIFSQQMCLCVLQGYLYAAIYSLLRYLIHFGLNTLFDHLRRKLKKGYFFWSLTALNYSRAVAAGGCKLS